MTSEQKLLYVVDSFPEVSETFIVHEVRELHRRGDRVRLYARARGTGANGHAGSAEVESLVSYRPRLARRIAAVAGAMIASPGRTLRALAWALSQRRYERGLAEAFLDACVLRRRAVASDRLHAHFAHWPASVVVLASLLTDTPSSFTAHARDIFCANPSALRRKVAMSRFAAVVTDHTREVLTAIAPEHAERIHIVRNGVDLARCRPRSGEGDPRERPLVLTVARLVEKKGVDVVIDACARSPAYADWLIVGDGPLRAELESRAADACPGRVTFTGALDHEEVLALLRRATVFTLPCRVARDGDTDALPVALTEALAAGLPVVTTGIGGIREVVRDEESGLLVDPDRPDQLAAAIDRVLHDGPLRLRLAHRGREAVAGYEISACITELQRRLRA